MSEPTIEIKGVSYPFPEGQRLVDPVLVYEVTGLEWQEFVSRWRQMIEDVEDAEGEAEVDELTLAGLIAMSVWQRNPTWRRDKARKFVEQINWEDIAIVGDDPDEAEEGENADPPQGVAGDSSASSTSSTTPSESNGPPADRSDLANQIVTGAERSALSSLA